VTRFGRIRIEAIAPYVIFAAPRPQLQHVVITIAPTAADHATGATGLCGRAWVVAAPVRLGRVIDPMRAVCHECWARRTPESLRIGAGA